LSTVLNCILDCLKRFGKPITKEQGADHVLRKPTGARKEALQRDVVSAADAIEMLLDYDFIDAQARVNGARG